MIQYQFGQVITSATKRKVEQAEPPLPGTSTTDCGILNYMPDHILISLAHTCDIDLGVGHNNQSCNLTLLRKLGAWSLEDEREDTMP